MALRLLARGVLRSQTSLSMRMQSWVWSRFMSTESTSFLREFGPDVADSLLQDGYAVIDNAISKKTAATLRSELEALNWVPGGLKANQTHFVGAGSQLLLTKPHVLEAEMHIASAAARAAAPSLCELAEDAALGAMLSCYAPALTLTEMAVKAQVNAGHGGCFPIHVDSDASVDRRVVTGLLYPNAEWDAERDGGALRLYPFPRRAQQARHVDIAPTEGRLVLLWSTELHHRVLPSLARRYCVTLWLSGWVRARGGAPAADCGDARAVLRAPRYRRYAAMVALAPAWEQSLRDAHAGAQADSAVQAHRDQVALTVRALMQEIPARYPRVDTAHLEWALADSDRLDNMLASGKEDGVEEMLPWAG